MKKLILSFLLVLFALPFQAQRIYQPTGRGVVAVTDDGGISVFVSWRKLTNDPDGCTYNLYRRAQGTTNYTKVNTSPIKTTCVSLTSSQLPYNNEIAVTVVSNGVESEKSVPFLYRHHKWNNVWMDIDVDTTLLKAEKFQTKYAWAADLDGDGEMHEFIIDRLGSGSYSDADNDSVVSGAGTDHYIQAYTIDGKLLWTVQMDPNVNIDAGQNDMITVYDIDCDGRAEVIIRSSDGTRFWDSKANTFGKYVFGKDTPDTDGDGIVDYCAESNTRRNPPFYISVIDGLTGEEKTSAELDYTQVHDDIDQYSRDNRSDYMSNNGYYQLPGHFAITYDGVHPLLMMKCLDRSATTGHHDYVFAFSYDWTGGTASNWHHSFTWSRNDKKPWPAEFHGNRVCDVDGDGIDELIPGAFAVNPWKGLVSNGAISHGDRFTVTDIDPDRPGLEEYAIQQSSLLGQVIYDAATGEHVKEWYLSSVYDVGRGECMDVDSTTRGLENYSFVSGSVYDCKGNRLQLERPYPQEGIWWDGDLLREECGSPGGSGYHTNLMVDKVIGQKRLIEFSKESGWQAFAGYGTRAAFWGDIVGDWREEVVLLKMQAGVGNATYGNVSTGIVGYSTNISTDKVITTLIEDPHYRLDCTTKGYYQTPNTDFYLATDMPKEPVYPCVTADLRYARGGWDGSWTSYDMTTQKSYADGQSVIFDITGDTAAVNIGKDVAPKAVYVMNPKGHDYTFTGSGALTGTMSLVKGMQGTCTLNNDLNFTGNTIISEGTLAVNGTITSPVRLMARGTLGGNATVNGGISFEGALNYEGCRIAPGTEADKYGTVTFNGNLTVPGNVYFEADIDTADGKHDKIVVNGDLTLRGINYITVNTTGEVAQAGTYTLVSCTGQLTANADSISVRNLKGVPYDVVVSGNEIQLVINDSRAAQDGIEWQGGESGQWDYVSQNFAIDGSSSYFVPGDGLCFGDSAKTFDVVLDDVVPVSHVTFNNTRDYTLSGNGGISGSGQFVKNGSGALTISLTGSTYTGATIINGGRLTVTSLLDGGKACSLGAADATEGNLQINGATLAVSADNMATDRIITITDTATIDVVQNGSSLSLKGAVKGSGWLVKDGPGQLNFNYAGANNFSGLILRGGTVAQGNYRSTFGKSGSPMRLEGGTVALIANTSMSTTPILNYDITVADGTENTIRGSYRSNIQGSISGSGTLTIRSGGVRCYVESDFSQFTGLLKASGSQFLVRGNAGDMTALTLEPQVGMDIEPQQSLGELKVGAIQATATDCTVSGNVVSTGYNNADASFSGKLKATTVNKYGTGTWTINSTGNTSALNVYGGTVLLRNFTSATIFSKPVNVMEGGTLAGRATTQSVVLYKGATLKPGLSDTGTSTFTTKGDIVSNGGATLVVKVSDANNDKFAIGGKLTLRSDTIAIRPIGSHTFSAGDELKIVTGTIDAASTWTVSSDGYEWDDSRLISDGVLVCKGAATAIKAVDANGYGHDNDTVDVYSISGAVVRENVSRRSATDGLPRGMYVIDGKKIVVR